MNEGNITVTLTESQHELIMNILWNMTDTFDMVVSDALMDLPLDNQLVQRYTMMENLRELFEELWSDRFKPSTETFV